jgi:segregation and condensation protein B
MKVSEEQRSLTELVENTEGEVAVGPVIDVAELACIVEAALLASTAPLDMPHLRRLFDDTVAADEILQALSHLQERWQNRGCELLELADGWRFRTHAKIQPHLDRLNPEKPPRYSRAVMETLAIIAYRQPVTRGDIEDIRGVTVSTQVIRTLEERGWIDTVGHRETPGRPALYATTRQFLDDLGLRSLSELPPLETMQAALEGVPEA